jgi:CheY-like chemotaxis protein
MIPSPSISLANSTILLVEDNESDIALTQRAFKRNRISNPIEVVGDGQSAVDRLLGSSIASAALPALVLLDLKLPKLDGIEVLTRLRADPRTRRLPVVVLTSSKEQNDMANCYDGGANSYIRKPVDFNQFSEAIQQIGAYWLGLNEPPPHG